MTEEFRASPLLGQKPTLDDTFRIVDNPFGLGRPRGRTFSYR